jgi:ABC-type uncharacterized transport system involved in gliding motility auxiliary subunit
VASPIAIGNPKFPITQDFDNGILFLKAGSLGYSTSTRLSGVEVESVVKSSPESWSESTDNYVFDKDVDQRKALDMALVASRKIPITSGDSEGEKTSNVLVVNDASFVQNANINSFLNRDFALNSADYLVEGQALMAIRPADKTMAPLDLSSGQRLLVMLFSVFLTPIFIAGLGVWVWVKRR